MAEKTIESVLKHYFDDLVGKQGCAFAEYFRDYLWIHGFEIRKITPTGELADENFGRKYCSCQN